MKKNFLRFLGMLVLALCITSCSKSNGDLIKEYSEVCEELADAYNEKDVNKIASLSEKGEKLLTEIEQRDLTDEEKAEVALLTLKLGSSIKGDLQQLMIGETGGLSGSDSGMDNDDNDADDTDNDTDDNDNDTDDNGLDF